MLRKIKTDQRAAVVAIVAMLILGVAAYWVGRTSGDQQVSAADSNAPRSMAEPAYEPDQGVPAARQVFRAKMISATGAWAMTPEGLQLTSDAGLTWKPATPDGVRPEWISGIFFSDPATGYVIVSPNQRAPHPTLELFQTGNGGQSWERSTIPTPRLLSIVSAEVYFRGDFGWLVAQEQSPGGSNSITRLFVSENSGRDWRELATRPPVPGELKFGSRRDGWVAGGVGSQALWHTEDGGESWSKVELEFPPGVPKSIVSYRAPEISSDGTGLLPVTFSKGEFQTEVEVYSSLDGGESWQPGPLVPVDGATEAGLAVKASFPDPESVAIISPGADQLSVVQANPTGSPMAVTPGIEETFRPQGLPSATSVDLVDDLHGIALISSASCSGCQSVGALYFTSDGGKTWTPSPSRP